VRFANVQDPAGRAGLAVAIEAGGFKCRWSDDQEYPGDLLTLLREGGAALSRAASVLATGEPVQIDQVTLKPPVPRPEKIICVGLNFRDHISEGGFVEPKVPEVFGRFASSLIGHGEALLRPRESAQLDFEGELAVVIGRRGRRIPSPSALDHVVGYSVFNDGTIRDYQFRTPQWTIGKNFDGTGAFGPALVTSDELPHGPEGLRLTTRLNGDIVQEASLDDMIFGVAELVTLVSEAMTLQPGDVIVCGTPSGVGFARKPPLYMVPGDVCEVEIEKIGLLRNTVSQD
jgi:acylpyruvate hydrolase